jgi:hypothetical protein
MPPLVPSPKSIEMPAMAQNLTVSGADPEVGEALNCDDRVSYTAPGPAATSPAAIDAKNKTPHAPIPSFSGSAIFNPLES